MAATRHLDDKTFSGTCTYTGTVTMTSATLTLPANSVDSDQYVNGSIDAAHLAANSVDSDQYVDGSIDPEHIAHGVDAFTDEAVAITNTTGDVIHLTTTGAGTNAITNTSMITGKVYVINMIAQATGTYEMANVDGSSTLTFNAAGERAGVYYDGTALRTAWLNGATLV